MLIDVHCHLDLLENIDKIINESRTGKNKFLIVTQGINPENNRKALELSEKYKEVKCALGIYPEDAIKLSDKQISDELKFIEKNVKANKVIAVGEIGLDGTYSNIEKQKKVFREIVKLAVRLDIPVIVHSRKAETLCVEELEKLKAKKVIMHCFSGNLNLVKRIAENGWFLSIPSNVIFSTHFQEVVKIIKIDNLLCETDSPYLHPEKKFPNNPLNVIYSYKKISEIKKLSLDKVEKNIENNFNRAFN
ncbi:MAG TPA: TatD family hydrolase [Candidatus Nanoarchaeia archaeon]|nr:TatD family hydrolase [Candidatus Nanoarchaeia archaeon]